MRFPSLLLALALLIPAARATSVVPPRFAELVAEADAIYRGRVTDIQARRVERADGNGSVIKTFVTFSIERTLKGVAQKEVTLQFLGGTIGDERLEVSGMPTFQLGAREIVFVQKNGTQFCPLVAMMHGRYRVLRDAATASDRVARDNGAPLTDPTEVELPFSGVPDAVRSANSASLARALTPELFESHIAREVDRSVLQARPN